MKGLMGEGSFGKGMGSTKIHGNTAFGLIKWGFI